MAEMRRLARIVGALMVVAGVLTLAWAVVVWRWEDPFTALYTHWQQNRLATSLDHQFAEYHPVRIDRTDLAAERLAISKDARTFRHTAKTRGRSGRIVIARIGLKMVVVNGTDEATLKKGPGRDARSYMPGQDRLVYIAGHRTTYLAPFSHIDAIRDGDVIRSDAVRNLHVSRVHASRRHRKRHVGAASPEPRGTRAAGVSSAFLCDAPLHRLCQARLGAATRRRCRYPVETASAAG